jgi:hypothetical protein
MKKIFLTLLSITFLSPIACQKRAASRASRDSSEKVANNIEVCSLITKAEIEAVQGSPVTETKSSDRAQDGLISSQCFYNTKEFNRSINLVLTHVDPRNEAGRNPRDLWKDMFARYSEDEEERERAEKKEKARGGEAEEHEGAPPTRITGLGEEAFWVGSRVGGALYVLKKNAFLFLSIGGPDPQEAKIDKVKTLAKKAVDRL